MSGERMRRFWDRRAREDPLHFVDTREPYGEVDEERFWAGGEEDLKRLFKALDVRLDGHEYVVEIGCGVGRLTRPIAARADRVIATDVSREMLMVARAESPKQRNVIWKPGDGHSLRGVPDASADACISHVVFQHIPDPAITLGYVREMGRVLRPGGWAAFQVSNDPTVHRAATHASLRERIAARLRAALGRGPRGREAREWLGSAVDLDDLRAVAEEAGMRVERVVGEGTQFCLVRARRL